MSSYLDLPHEQFVKDSSTRIKESVYFIEANSFEQMTLWRENHEKLNWEEDGRGFSFCVGFIDPKKKTKAVYVTFSFAKILGHQICFYEATSRFVDHDMIEKYINKNYIKTKYPKRDAMTDAMNFHQAVHAIENLNKK